MTSQLASQLQRLQQRPDGSQHRLAKSFLFSTQDAQSFSREQIHQLALNGLQALTAIDNRFHPFIQDLFDVKRVRQERSMLTTTEDSTLRVRLEHFLTFLSPHLFLTAAQQVFEFLVRVYEVHIYDVASVLRAFLPYHDHNIFARALLLLDLRDTGFDFLATNQLHGAPLLREHLVLACAESRKAVRLVCLTVAMPFRYEIRHHAANALFASVVTRLTTHKDAEALWRTFLPFVLELLSGAVSGAEAGTEESKRARQSDNARGGSSRVSMESVATALVVLAAWSAHVRFSKAMLITMLKPIFRYTTAAAFAATSEGHHGAGVSYLPVRDLLALLEIVLATQHHALSDVSVAPLLQTLLTLPWRTLASQLPFAEMTVMVAGPNGAPTTSPRHSALLATLLQTALERLSSVSEARLLPSDVVEFLTCAAEDLPLSNYMVTRYLRVLMTAEAGTSPAGAVGDTPARAAEGASNQSLYYRLAAALERRYAIVFDGVLSEVLLHPETTAAATAFLARHFRGTRYGMVEVGSTLSGATETLPLFACLLHPVPEVRALAAKTLEGMPTAQLISDASAASGSGQSLVDLLAHVISYEHNCTAAEAFVATAAAVIERLAARWSSEKSMGRDELGCRAACQLVRSVYSMVLAWSPSVASAAPASVATRAEAQRRVVLPLVTTLLRPALLTWTRGASAVTSAAQDFRTSVLYHATLLYAQWTGTPSAAMQTPGEDVALAAQVVRGLVATLEAGCGGQDAVAPLFRARSASDKEQDKKTARDGSSGKKERQRVGRRCIAAAESDSDDDKEQQQSQAGSSGRSGCIATGARIACFTDLIQCDALLDAIRTEAQRRLPDAFAAARTAVREAATDLSSAAACEVEVAVALAAAVLPAIGTEVPANVLETVSAVVTFLHGGDAANDAAASETAMASSATSAAADGGYLDMVYATLLDNSSGRRVAQAGRGTVDAATAAREQLYEAPLVARVGAVLRAALTRVLARAGTAAAASVSSWASLVLQLCQGLGFVGAALPSIAVQPDVLAPAYLELISSMNAVTATAEATSGAAAALRQVDWYALVADAVFSAAGQSEVNDAPYAKPVTLAALALVLFLPLRAPSAQRLAQLRALQGAVVTAGAQHGSTRGGANGRTGEQVILAAAMQLQQGTSSSTSSSACSATALSCLIECMAVEERQYQLTPSAAALVCSLLNMQNGTDGGAQAYVVPVGWAHRVVRYFFRSHNSHGGERARAGSSAAAAALLPAEITPQQVCLIEAMLPRVEGILTRIENVDASSSSSTRTVTADAADLVDAVCSRLQLWGSASAKEDAVAGNASVRLVELLLKHPYVHVHHGGGARPVYRYALAALAVGLSYGLEDRQSTQSTIFKSRKSASTAASRKGEYALSAEYQRLVAARLQPVVLHAIDVIGTDVALACMGTLGGYEYFFLPLVASVESATASAGGHPPVTSKAKAARGRPSQAMSTGRETASEAVAVLLKRVHEMLETLAPSTAAAADETPSAKHNGVTELAAEGEDVAASASEARWRPPASAAVANPLTFADARRVLRLPSVCAAAAGGTGKWPLGALSHESLRLLCTLLRVLPTIAMDEEEDGESVFALVMECVELYPLQGMEVLLRHAASSAASDDVAMLPRVTQLRLGARGSLQVEGVLRFVKTLVHVCTDQTQLLSEKVTDGAHRIKSLLLREMMVLMARILVDDRSEDNGAETDEEASAASPRRAAVDTEAAERRQGELHFHVDTIAGLLRATAPLLKVPTAAAAAAVTARPSMAESSTYLHIPLVSLLIKLEPFDNTEALGFRSARDVCQEILSNFDVRTQVECLGQLMRLVADPAAQLSSGANAGEDGEEQQRVQHLFRRMVKPNQVINRQEAIMHLVNLTVKSDLFLEPFLALQRHARSSQPSRAAERRRQQQQRGERSTGADKADEKASDADEEAEEQAEGAVQREDGGCMGLLVSALELFARYHDLHETTRSGAASASADAEAEAYTSLLELLAGNTLACVLAGINEPTFVVCQQRLLGDERAALRKIGLEVLLDRLHHSLPTLENVVSDEEMEAHRRRLRDPRQRLSLVDLVRIKARPLTTKRSIQLFPLLVAEIKSSVAQFHAAAQSANAAGELLTTAQLGIAAVEELIRIVSSGGSLQSEKTLLNANRSKRVTEAALVKLFGNRSRVAAVHELVDLICNHWMPLLTRCEMRLRSRAEQPGTDGGAYDSTAASRSGAEENVLGCMTCLVTALATITQVMGTAFASTHCLHLLHTLVSAGVYQVLEMPGVVSRSEAGALLRHSTLSSMIRCFPACWQMTQPYLPSMLFLATHLRNVTDAESHYLCAEMLAVLEAVMEPQLLLDAGRTCLQGLPYLNGAVVPASEQHQLVNLAAEAAASASEPGKAKKGTVRVRQIRAQVHTHSFALLFTCFERRVENMSKEELLHMRTLTEGTTPQQNFWLAAFQSLASAPSVPSSEAVMPVLQAFTVFLLKFKAKHSVRLLRIVADWAFAESSGGVAGASRKHAAGPGDSANTAAEEEQNGRGHDGAAQSISRVTLQSWIVFFALSNHLLGKLGSILDFAFPILLPHVVTALRTYCAATATASKAMDSLVALALEGALECMRNMALAQTPGPDHDYSIQVDVYFAKADVFPSVMPALVNQLHNLHYLEDSQRDYRFRVEHNVIPAIRAFMACLGSSKLQSRTQAEVVRALRHPSRHVRREALICLDGIYADGGDELASRLMAEMLPTVVELTEDRDDTVVEEARKLCNNLSHMTGQDVLYAMS